jgi:signal transduction histidine kinase
MDLPESQEGKVQALERELGEFAYIVSHDLAACFRHIRGFSELIIQDAGSGFTPDHWSYCNQIHGAAEKCAAMLDQLLLYSRTTRKMLDIVPTDFAPLLDAARLQLGAEIRQSGAQIVASGSARLAVDRDLFVQALKHLLGNAVKYRRPGITPRVTVQASQDEGRVRIRIGDNGIGLPPEMDAEKLFWMFHRGHGEGAYPGFGTGLTFARRILRRHGGDVHFVPAAEGTWVEMDLPCGSQA